MAYHGKHAYFRQQLSYWREKGGGAHIGALQRSAAFRELVGAMRTVATDYLRAHRVPDAASLVEESPLFCWASVHTGGSTHPPHVHSDAVGHRNVLCTPSRGRGATAPGRILEAARRLI